MQAIQLDKHIRLLDSPGVVMATKMADTATLVLRNCVRVSEFSCFRLGLTFFSGVVREGGNNCTKTAIRTSVEEENLCVECKVHHEGACPLRQATPIQLLSK